ncbi:hypothetical protein GR212_15370 [Rhizobium lusitanum]|uniref:Uncharacterized protein n=1 Tax=Rhizobium lusitanum TaxID=293958 RepID=A0A6L9U4W8_9HYPH|nr:hypothetical protein [Rhizobium lusitanum]NEI70963.1 hypothetical protein [Rhizobium lusitanum]
MRVVKKTGLVPVHTKHDTKVFGVSPTVAAKGVAEGSLFLADIPEGVETTDVAAPAPSVPLEPLEVDGVVQIPDNWEDLHYATKIALARSLLGGELPEIADKKPAEVARDIIQEEVARRAASAAE